MVDILIALTMDDIMKIYAIWKLTDTTSDTVEKIYANELYKSGMTEEKELAMIKMRIANTPKAEENKQSLISNGYADYAALSYYNEGRRAFLKGACLVIGDNEFGQIAPNQVTNLLRNILTDGRDLQDIIDDPNDFCSRYDFILKEDEQPSLSCFSSAQRFFPPNKLDTKANATYQSASGFLSCLFKGCL